MRRALMVFLVVLTALRGLAGDAMALMPFAPASIPAHTPSHTRADIAPHSSTADTPHEAAAPLTSSGPPCHEAAAATDDSGHSTLSCSTCQLCHLSAFTPTSASLRLSAPAHAAPTVPVHAAPTVPVHAAPTVPVHAWASAERAGPTKPPIL